MEKPSKKVSRKQKRCEKLLSRHEGLQASPEPSKSLLVGNGGLVCEIQSELLLDVFSKYGCIKNIVMLPDKPYSFIIFNEMKDAEQARDGIHGQKLESGHTFYISFMRDDDVPQNAMKELPWPQGLIILEDFLSEKSEEEFLEAVDFNNLNDKGSMKHRQVKHFGYEFLYGSNNIDKDKCLDDKIPAVCQPHLEKLVALGYIPRIPDQLTVNRYKPGQGIPSHIDTHSAFEDGIISISLGSQVVMDFSTPGRDSVPILIPQRSALIMTGESRYAWRHGITPRKTDVIHVDTDMGQHLTVLYRSTRTSFTFRLIRKGSCDCDFKEQCDSQKPAQIECHDLVNEQEAKELENKYVTQVYEQIAHHFSDTRYKPWPRVADFIASIPVGSVILDVGCGNGKNMGISKSCFEIGCDVSSKLAEVCSTKNLEVLVADCLALPFRDNCADAIICIAVIHHMATKVRRAKVIEEIVRVLRPEGRALIYVWALEQDGPNGPSNYLKTSRVLKKELSSNVNTTEQISQTLENEEIKLNINDKELKMAVHRNRTNFDQQDVLVPWTKKDETDTTLNTGNVHHRYYHVFTAGELKSLVLKSNVKILDSYYDKGNWCVVFEKNR